MMKSGPMFILLLHVVCVDANMHQYQHPHRQRRRSTSYKLDYYSHPQLHWKSRLEGLMLDSGNAVEQSPFHEEYIYVTTKQGNLAVLSATDGILLTTIQPATKSFLVEGEIFNGTITSSSGISFGYLEDRSQFLVYTVVDVPPAEIDGSSETRVIAVSIPQHEELWSSDSLPGENAGSPVVVQTTSQKSYIALTHNSDIEIPDEDFMKAGHFTLIQADNGYVVWTESEWSRNQLPKGYAPPGVAPKSIIDDGGKEGQNQNDLVVWASNDQQGRGKQGHIFGFQLPSNFDVTENEVLNRSSIVAKQVQWTSKSSPVFGSDGKSMYMGVTGDHLRGWVENTPFEAPADWSSDLSMVDADGLTAIPVTPTLSIDGERLFVSTSTTHAFCIDTKTGQKLWDLPGASTFLAAQVSPDDQRVYFLQSIDGRLFAYEQQSGAFSWVSSCDAFEEDCSNTVRASFSLSRTGQFLFYADVLGQVLALKLAEYVTIDEDVGNGLSEEDSLNEKQPISELSETSTESTTNEGISTGGSVALIILVLLMAVSAGVSLFLIRKARGRARRKVDNAHQRSTKDDDWFETNKLKLPGPDPYEDSMLAKQSPHLELTFQNSIWVDEICQRTNDMATNDRAPKIFGTIRVTPFQAEDYSLGAAILV